MLMFLLTVLGLTCAGFGIGGLYGAVGGLIFGVALGTQFLN